MNANSDRAALTRKAALASVATALFLFSAAIGLSVAWVTVVMLGPRTVDALAAAVVLVVLGLTLHVKMDVIADGLLLGGVFTLLYSIGRSFVGDDSIWNWLSLAQHHDIDSGPA